jgi:acetyl esterase/lipase
MSNSSNTILQVLKWIHAKERFQKLFHDPPRNTRTLNPRKIKRSLKPELWSVDGWKLLTIHGRPTSQTHLIFLPGGAYLLEATAFHRKFAEKIAKTSGLSVTMVDYPKSPEYSYHTTHDLIWKAYHQLVQRYPDHEFCFLGDSAGGGLALAFLQTLRDQKITPLPPKCVLISPWLDLSLSHPQIPAFVSRDLILTLEGLEYAADLYAGGEDLQNPLLSPLYGDLNLLGEILLIAGTEELFYPDCQELGKKIKAARGTKITLEMGENLIHAWPIFPFPESKQAVERIADFLR